jgi:hypothetical protein
MLNESEAEERAYDQASQVYWERLHQSVQTVQPPPGNDDLTEEDFAGLSATKFAFGETRVKRVPEHRPHVVYVTNPQVGTYVIELHRVVGTASTVEAVCTQIPETGTSNVRPLASPKHLTLPQMVALIVNPLDGV